MLRSVLIAICLVGSLSFPAFAGCNQWCMQNMCSQAIQKPVCMNKCVAACQSKHGKTQ